jgi:hypothetical protein
MTSLGNIAAELTVCRSRQLGMDSDASVSRGRAARLSPDYLALPTRREGRRQAFCVRAQGVSAAPDAVRRFKRRKPTMHKSPEGATKGHGEYKIKGNVVENCHGYIFSGLGRNPYCPCCFNDPLLTD